MMRECFLRQLFLLLLSLCVHSVQAAIYQVGPEQTYRKPSELVNRVKPGDIIEIHAGVYLNDAAVWRTDHLTFRGVNGRPELKFTPDAVIANRKAIWVIAGDHITIENLAFSGAHVPSLNGAGLRVEGADLGVRNCYFHHNEFAILSGVTRGRLLVENSEFAYQHRKGRFAHGVYIGNAEHFVFRGNYVHHSDGGHHVKSRALKSEILFNYLTDEKGGNASYLIDLPNCGEAVIKGNLLFKGRRAENFTAIAYGAEGCVGKPKSLVVMDNTYVNEHPQGGNFIRNWSQATVQLKNNVLVGKIKRLDTTR